MIELINHNGYQLIERYSRNYIRFIGGIDDITPCEIPASNDERVEIERNPCIMPELVKTFQRKTDFVKDIFYEVVLREYMMFARAKSWTYSEILYNRLQRYTDIRNEFYDYIMNEQFSDKPIMVEGYTVQSLCKQFGLSPLGAYNYLVYLRENKDIALKMLETGLPQYDLKIGLDFEEVHEEDIKDENVCCRGQHD